MIPGMVESVDLLYRGIYRLVNATAFEGLKGVGAVALCLARASAVLPAAGVARRPHDGGL